VLAIALLLVSARVAHAESSNEAERMFELGRQAATQGQYSTACNLFKESYRLDPAVGTLINLGDCEEHQGHPREALVWYEKAFSRLSVTDDRMVLVQQRIQALEKTGARLEIRTGAGAPPETKVTLDGELVDATRLKTPILLPAGNHVVVATAVGYRGSRQGVSLKEGEARALQVWPGPPLDEAVPTFVEAAPDNGRREREARASTWRTVGYGAGAAGLASLWVGSITGFLALDRESLRSKNCNAENVCNQTGYDAAQSGKTLATVSTVTVVAGGLALGVGAYLVLSNRAGSTQTALVPNASHEGGGMSLLHRF
jgi:tetratricopeptide (TPR) repeat protein